MSSRLKPLVLNDRTLGREGAGAGREGGRVAEMQQRRLLLAFGEVVSEVGLENAGVGRVCARAGVSRRTFYELFEDREACFLALVDAVEERVSASVLSAFAREGRWRERVRGALGVLLEFFEDEPALARVCLVEALKAGPAVIERRRRVLDALAGAVDEGRLEAKAGPGPPPLTAQSTVGGAVAVIHARVLEGDPEALTMLLSPLVSMIVYPYLGSAAARRELERPLPASHAASNGRHRHAPDPFKDLPIRMTLRTAHVLAAIASHPHSSNRQIGDAAGITDQGQISKLLTRLHGHELIENHGQGHTRGEPNDWTLTQRGHAILHAIGEDDAADA